MSKRAPSSAEKRRGRCTRDTLLTVLLVETPNELVVAVSLTSAVSWTEVKLLVVTTLLVVGSAASLFKVSTQRRHA